MAPEASHTWCCDGKQHQRGAGVDRGAVPKLEARLQQEAGAKRQLSGDRKGKDKYARQEKYGDNGQQKISYRGEDGVCIL